MQFLQIWFEIFVHCVILAPVLAINKNHVCLKEVISRNGTQVIWPKIELDKNLMITRSTLSIPPCINERNEFVIRNCTTNGWDPIYPPVDCRFPKRNVYCPQELTEIQIKDDEYLCVKISLNKHNWMENSCFGSDKTIFDLKTNERNIVLDFLHHSLNISRFWLPARRAKGNPYNPLVWYLPGKEWGEEISRDYEEDFTRVDDNTDYDGGGCAIAVINSPFYTNNEENDNESRRNNDHHHRQHQNDLKIIIGNCNEQLRSICIFEKSIFIESKCPLNYAALSYKPSMCYGFNMFELSFVLSNHRDNNRIDHDIVPYMGLNYLQIVRDDNIFQRFLDYYDNDMDKRHKTDKRFKPNCLLNRRPEQYYESNYNEIVLKSNGELQIYPQSNCYLNAYQLLKRRSVQMYLNFNTKRNSLVLTVYNYKDIWRETNKDEGIKCFTNADYEQIRTIKIKDRILDKDDRVVFELKLYGDGPGYYWCEAHTIYDFEFVKTSNIVASKRSKGHSFAFLFNIPCNLVECFDIHKNMKNYGKRVEKILNEMKQLKQVRQKFRSLVIHNVRIMNIERIVTNAYIVALCHATITMKSSYVDNLSSSEEWDSEEEKQHRKFEENGIQHDIWIRYKLKNLLTDLMRINGISTSVNSTEYCFPEPFLPGSTNRWRPAKIGQQSTTMEMCLTNFGLPVTRKCIGDFMYGAIWEPILDENIFKCISKPIQNIITTKLYEIERTNAIQREPKKIIRNLKHIIDANVNKLIPADFYYLSNIMNSFANKIVGTIVINDFGDDTNNNGESNGTITTTMIPEITTTTIDTSDNSRPANDTDIIISILDVIKSSSSDIVSIYNSLMNVNVNMIKPSIKLNSTNILLEAFETIFDEITLTTTTQTTESDKNKTITNNTTCNEANSSDKTIDKNLEENCSNFINDNENGVSYYFSSKLLVFMIDPSVANVSGIALYSNQSIDEYEEQPNFLNTLHHYLYTNQSIYDYVFDDDLELATFAPHSLLDQLIVFNTWSENDTTTATTPIPESTISSESIISPKIVIKIYFNDHFFQEDRDVTDKKVFSKIISISIPGFDHELPEMFPILIRNHASYNDIDNSTTLNATDSCRYWNYSTWADDGLEFQSAFDNLIWCGFSHLTPFAYLVGGTYNLSASSDIVIITSIHQEALDIITLLGCSLSLIGIMGIFVTAITFRIWREKPSSKVLLQLSFAIAIQMILFCFVNTEVVTSHLIENEIYSSCIALGALLHYSVLVQFSWMLIIAYLQYKRYVQIIGNSRPTRFFSKTFIFGWGIPLIPVLLLCIINEKAYIPYEDENNSRICYPSGQALYLAVVLPIALIITANLIIFILIIYNIIRSTIDGKARQNERKLAVRQVRLSILLFFLLGFTWIFGLLSTMKAGILFSYLFCLTATLQGFVLFIYFIVLDPVTRKLWSNIIFNNKKDNMK